jgi:hypothetical protein
MDMPKNFVPHELWPEYNWVLNPPNLCRREVVPNVQRGIRWSLGPITLEMHAGDEEPRLDTGGKLARPRIVRWNRVRRTDVPAGWHEARHPWRVDAYHTLAPDYAARWNKSSRRDLRLWKDNFLDKTHRIEPVSWHEYETAYRKSLVFKKIGDEQMQALGRRYAAGGPELWGVRNGAGQVIAGTAIHHSPTYKSSMREGPFILPEARDCFAMTGLMDFWFDRSLSRGVELQVFSYFNHAGTPKDWAGFSAFKRQFGITEVAYPPMLWRIVGGKLF